jgi:two-component system LytT family response regulator
VPDPLRVLIVDDEAPARSLLREYLGAYTGANTGAHGGVEVIGECVNGFEAVKAITEQKPNLVFLDVQMPKLDGFEVLELVAAEPGAPAVIFCTAYDEYALRAFEVHAVDYLLKPFGRERLAEALGRARDRLALAASRAPGPPAGPAGAALAATARGPGRWSERIVVRDGAQVHVVPTEQVDYVEAQDDYVAIHGAGRSHLKHQTLAELAVALDPARFVRIHRSFLVNVERIARVELLGKDQRVVILRDGRQLPVSRSGHERLREQWS